VIRWVSHSPLDRIPVTQSSAPLRVSNVRNVLANWGAFVISAAAGLFVSPFVVRTLGASSYGVWIIIGSLTGTLNFLDLGIRSAVIRFVARNHAREDHDAASRIVGTARLVLLSAGGIVLLLSGVFAARLEIWFNLPPELAPTARLVLIIAAATLAIVLSNGLYGGILTGLQRLDLIGATDSGIELVRIVLTLVVLGLGGGLIGLVMVGLLLTLVRRSIYGRAVARLYPQLNTGLRRPLRDDLSAIFSVSAYSTLIYSAVSVTSQAHTLIVAAFSSAQMVAYFAVGGTLPLYAAALNRPIAQTVHPRASRLEGLNDVDGLRALVLDTSRFSALILLPMVITLVFRGESFIGIWMGEEFRVPAGRVLSILSVGIMFSGSRHVIQAAFIGSGRHKTLAPWYLGEAAVMVLAGLWAVPRFGITGAAFASVIPSMAVTTILFPLLVRLTFGIPTAVLWGKAWVQPLVALLPFTVLTVWVDGTWPATSYATFFAQVAASLPLAAFGVWTVGLTSVERVYLRELLLRRMGMMPQSSP